MSGGGLRPTVEAVWLQWPTPGAPSAAIELNGKSAILCVFIFHAAFGEPSIHIVIHTQRRRDLRGPAPFDRRRPQECKQGRPKDRGSAISSRPSKTRSTGTSTTSPTTSGGQQTRRTTGTMPGRYYTTMVRHQKGGRPDEPQEPGGCNSESCTTNNHFFRAAGARAKCRVPASCKIFWFEVLSIGTQFSLPSFLSFPFDSFQSTQPLEPRKTFLSLRPCLKRRETLKNFVTHGDIERRTRSLRRARSVERRLGHTTCCFYRRSSDRQL